MHFSEHSELTPDKIWSMLSVVDAYDREDWWKVGMALKAHLGDAGWPLFDDWSQTANNYSASSARSTWRSFRGSGVGIGTLVYMAKQSGYNGQAPTRPAPAPRQAPKPKQSNTGRYAAELWLAADCDDSTVMGHQYGQAKKLLSAGGAGRGIATGSIIGKRADCIIVPIREHGDGKVQAVECINPQGKKQTFGPKSGGYLLLGNTLDKSIPWYVAEGWASAYSMVFHWPNPDGSKWDNCACAVSFGKGNLDHCAEQIAEHHAPDKLTIMVERDK